MKIAADGWLKEFLDRQMSGLTGHIENAGQPFNRTYWGTDTVGKDGSWHPYEQTAYWLDGLIRCSAILGDEAGLKRASDIIYKTLENADADGYLGPAYLKYPDYVGYSGPDAFRNPDAKPFSVEEFIRTYRQCEALVEKGLIRHIGISNMTIPKLEAVLPLMKILPVACEMELHPCFQQQELFDYLTARNIQPIGFMPLGSPQRPERDMCPEDVADLQTPIMQEIAKAHGVHPALIALKWAHQRGQIPIPFSVHEAEYVSNLKSMTEDPLTEEEIEAYVAAGESRGRAGSYGIEGIGVVLVQSIQGDYSNIVGLPVAETLRRLAAMTGN